MTVDNLLTYTRFANENNLNVPTFFNLLKAGYLPSVTVDRRLYVNQEDLQDFLRKFRSLNKDLITAARVQNAVETIFYAQQIYSGFDFEKEMEAIKDAKKATDGK